MYRVRYIVLLPEGSRSTTLLRVVVLLVDLLRVHYSRVATLVVSTGTTLDLDPEGIVL